MSAIFSDRLILIPCTLNIAKALIFHRVELNHRSPVDIPLDWPSVSLKGILPLYIERLEKDPSEIGWGIWIMIEYYEKKIIGEFVFKAKPTKENCVEIGYNVSPDFRKKGYGFEAVQKLIDWAFSKGVKAVVAECDVGNKGSIRILEKVGMICVCRDQRFLKWKIEKE